MLGLFTFWFWPLLFLAPVALFWLAWMGMFTFATLTWMAMTWRLWVIPVALMLVAFFVVGPLLHGVHHLIGMLISVALWIVLPIALGIWFARKFPSPHAKGPF
jgi:hypothetical protein